MRRSILALTACATLALTACGGGDSEPTKTVTETSAPTASADTADAPEGDAADAEPTDADGGGVDLWGNLPTYTDAYSLAQAVGDDYWSVDPDGFTEFDCIKSNQYETQERDEYTGEVADVSVIECSREGTEELATITVADDYSEELAVPICDEAFEADTCFTGRGWRIDAANTGMLKEMLEAIDVDPADWAVGEGEDW